MLFLFSVRWKTRKEGALRSLVSLSERFDKSTVYGKHDLRDHHHPRPPRLLRPPRSGGRVLPLQMYSRKGDAGIPSIPLVDVTRFDRLRAETPSGHRLEEESPFVAGPSRPTNKRTDGRTDGLS